jgi:hypothetical protein
LLALHYDVGSQASHCADEFGNTRSDNQECAA